MLQSIKSTTYSGIISIGLSGFAALNLANDICGTLRDGRSVGYLGGVFQNIWLLTTFFSSSSFLFSSDHILASETLTSRTLPRAT